MNQSNSRSNGRRNRGAWRAPLTLVLLFLLLTLFPAACKDRSPAEGTVAEVNGEPIPFSVFWQEFELRRRELGPDTSPQEKVLLSLKREALSDLIRRKLLLGEAARRNLYVTDEVLDSRLNELQRGYDVKLFQRDMVNHPAGYEGWRGSVRDNMIMELLFQDVVSAADPVTEKEVREDYSRNPDLFQVPESVRVKQIVVRDIELANLLYSRIKKGEDFAVLASKHSVTPDKEGSGHAGVLRKGELPEEVEKAAFGTRPGGVTPPISTGYGFLLLKIEEQTPAHLASLDEVSEEITVRLRREKQEAFYAQWIQNLIRSSDIRVNRALRDTLEQADGENLAPVKQEEDHENLAPVNQEGDHENP